MAPTSTDSGQLITLGRAAYLAGIRRQKLFCMVRNGRFPRPAETVGNQPRWRKADIESWIQHQPLQPAGFDPFERTEYL